MRKSIAPFAKGQIRNYLTRFRRKLFALSSMCPPLSNRLKTKREALRATYPDTQQRLPNDMQFKKPNTGLSSRPPRSRVNARLNGSRCKPRLRMHNLRPMNTQRKYNNG